MIISQPADPDSFEEFIRKRDEYCISRGIYQIIHLPHSQMTNARENKNLRHPSSDPNFGKTMDEPVWYLSHPLAPDEQFTFKENMDDVVRIMRICYEEGIRVIAPYHTICIALDDDNSEWRRIGLEVDCNVARLLGRIILSGHKLSSGMRNEAEAAMKCKTGGYLIDIRNMDEKQIRLRLQTFSTSSVVPNG